MDLIRFDTVGGVLYVDSRAMFLLTPADETSTHTSVQVAYGGTVNPVDLTLLGDVDEVAAAMERAIPDCRIHRVI